MKRSIFILIIVQALAFNVTTGQENGVEGKLAGLFNRLAAARDDSVKVQINDSIDSLVGRYSGSDSVFSRKLTGIRYLGQIVSEDSKLKILTWNLILRNSPGNYYCYFINRSGKTNSVYRLAENYKADKVRTDTLYTNSDWYGALYYAARPVRNGNQTYWMVLGVDYGNPSVTRKVIDVVSFGPGGKISFGRKLFAKGDELTYRVVLEYSPEAVVSLKFAGNNKIVFDHLVPVSSEFSGNREKYAPEFSYDGYILEKGMWVFRENVDIRNKR
jgi:hypothetical protein